MILQVIPKNKFVEYAINRFSAFPEVKVDNVILVNQNQTIDINNFKNTRIVVRESKEYHDLIDNLENYTAIILHGIEGKPYEHIIEQVYNKVKIAWVYWGYELYGRRDREKNYMSYKTLWAYYKYVFPKRFKNVIGIIKHRDFQPYRYSFPTSLFKCQGSSVFPTRGQ